MHSRLFLALGTAACLLTANTAFGQEVTPESTKGETSGNATAGNGTMSSRGGGNVEHRRNDHTGPTAGSGRGGSLSGDGGHSGGTGGGESGGGSDGGEGGGGDGGSTD